MTGSNRSSKPKFPTEGFTYAPSVWDPFSARIAESSGFTGVALGGYALGAATAITEPLLSLPQMVSTTRDIAAAVSIPLLVDAATGFGDPMHIVHTVRELEHAGASAIHIEDQIFPKRAHYHRGLEHVVSVDEMCTRISYADRARTPELTLIARTDSMATDGFEEGLHRATSYFDAGADMVLVFPNSREEARLAPQRLSMPLVTVNSPGNRFGRPVMSANEASSWGYTIVIDSAGPLLAAHTGIVTYLENVASGDFAADDDEQLISQRKSIEDLIGLEESYAIEEETVENG